MADDIERMDYGQFVDFFRDLCRSFDSQTWTEKLIQLDGSISVQMSGSSGNWEVAGYTSLFENPLVFLRRYKSCIHFVVPQSTSIKQTDSKFLVASPYQLWRMTAEKGINALSISFPDQNIKAALFILP